MHQILSNIYFTGAYFLHLQKVKCYYHHFNIDISFLWTVYVLFPSSQILPNSAYHFSLNHHLLLSPLFSAPLEERVFGL